MKNNEEIISIEQSIANIESSIKENEAKIESLKYRKKQLIQYYHNILVEVGFYDNYFYYPTQKSLADEFHIKGIYKNNLPHIDMGEGDYKKVSFKATENRLTLLHYCTCEWGNQQYKHLIDIPLDLLENADRSGLVSFLEDWFKKSKETHDRIKKEAKEKQIAKLQSEIEDLKTK